MALNFQQSSSGNGRRVILVVCIAVAIVLVVIYANESDDGALHDAQGTTSELFSPLTFVGSGIGSGLTDAANAIADLTADEDSITALQEANAELIDLLAQADEYRQEAERLQALLDLRDAYDIEGVAANVIGRSTTAWDQTITIDKGSEDGIDTGLTVMGSSGVVGMVVDTTENTATVRLITDPQSGAAAMVQSSRAEGIVTGSLEGLLYLEDLDADADVEVGDIVVTSGLGGSYVSGLVIGTVVKVESQAGDTSIRAVVSPNEDASTLEEVLVVFSVGSSADDDSEDEDDSDSSDSSDDSEASESDESTTDASETAETTETSEESEEETSEDGEVS